MVDKFKVGDKVKVKGTSINYGVTRIGWVGTVIEVFSDNYISVGDKIDNYIVNAEHFEIDLVALRKNKLKRLKNK